MWVFTTRGRWWYVFKMIYILFIIVFLPNSTSCTQKICFKWINWLRPMIFLTYIQSGRVVLSSHACHIPWGEGESGFDCLTFSWFSFSVLKFGVTKYYKVSRLFLNQCFHFSGPLSSVTSGPTWNPWPVLPDSCSVFAWHRPLMGPSEKGKCKQLYFTSYQWF